MTPEQIAAAAGDAADILDPPAGFAAWISNAARARPVDPPDVPGAGGPVEYDLADLLGGTDV